MTLSGSGAWAVSFNENIQNSRQRSLTVVLFACKMENMKVVIFFTNNYFDLLLNASIYVKLCFFYYTDNQF
jgi:hypothetical protein